MITDLIEVEGILIREEDCLMKEGIGTEMEDLQEEERSQDDGRPSNGHGGSPDGGGLPNDGGPPNGKRGPPRCSNG